MVFRGWRRLIARWDENEDAERLLKQVLAADPRRANDALVLGDLYMRAGDYDSALDALDRAERAILTPGQNC